MENKYICIHGHFYQPPRENAWLETIQRQESANPFHDWNERINFECYAPNAAARLTDGEKQIIKITNNYKRINFNIGPTLMSWIEDFDPDTYQRILEADRRSQDLFDGHGSAIAQVYNHMIMPLANRLDKETQIIWGIADFERHFLRKPEGIWLAETAVDFETLELCVKHGIKYTILAPRQAKAFRKIGDPDWIQGGVDSKRPYLCHLPNGTSIHLFVYDGEIAQDVAFKGILNDGYRFAQKLASHFDNNDYPQLVHVATDGESYGHHHHHGEMALAACIDEIDKREDVSITNYGQYLELFPVEYEIQIHENSSWSCVHGIERWRSNCGCNTGGTSWHQEWRSGLRNLLDELRDKVSPIFEKTLRDFGVDPWNARNEYIDVILNRSQNSLTEYLETIGATQLENDQIITLFRSLEMQRNAMLMFTSCAWFFDELSGIETNQVLQYALRVIKYTEQISDFNFYDEFVAKLKKIPSNVFENGAESFLQNVVPSQLELRRAGIHFAIYSLFTKDPENITLYNYSFEIKSYKKIRAGIQKFAVGQISMRSKVTHSRKDFCFSVLYLGQQNIIGSIMKDMEDEQFWEMYDKGSKAFQGANLGMVINTMEEYFDGDRFTIWHLFQDEKKTLLKDISTQNLQKLETDFREVYNDNYQLMNGMLNANFDIPDAFMSAVRYILNYDLAQFFKQPKLRINELRRLASEIEKWNIKIENISSFKLSATERIFYEISALSPQLASYKTIVQLNDIFEIIYRKMDIPLSVWKSQNRYYRILRSFQKKEAEYPNEAWKDAFFDLGRNLGVKVW